MENKITEQFVSEQEKDIAKNLIGMPETLRSMYSELTFIGMLYKKPILSKRYEKSINPDYDLTTEANKFFYTQLLEMVKTSNYQISEYSINAYMGDNIARMKQYEKFGGYRWIEFALKMAEENNAVENSITWYNNLKRYTVTRAFWLYGFKEPAEKLVKLKDFQKLEPKQLRKYVIEAMNKVYVNVTADNTCHTLTERCKEYVEQCIDIPQKGTNMVFPILGQVFNGYRMGQFMAFGMLSNSGKTRFMIRAVANLALVEGKKCCIISNEMTEEEMRACLITTVINNEELQNLHNIKINKTEREIQNGIYRADEEFKDKEGVDSNGIVRRLADEEGNYIEKFEDYEKRVEEYSSEYRKVKQIAHWIDTEMKDKIKIVETGSNYSDEDLKLIIEDMIVLEDIKYFFYDTFKSDKDAIGDWASLKRTSTVLSEITKKEKIFMWANIQLTDDAVKIEPAELSSNNIANCKQMKHVLDSLCLIKEVPKDKFIEYVYNDDITVATEDYMRWYNANVKGLDENKRYYFCKVDKNRAGTKPNVLFEVDLDLNVWKEVGSSYKVETKNVKGKK